MTLREIVYDIYNTMHNGRTNDTELISYSQIEFIIKNTRSTLIRQDIQKGRTISENIISHVYGQKLILVDTSDVPCRLPSGCYVVRTENKFPHFVEVNDRDLLLSVQPSTVDSQNYTIIPRSRVSYLGRNKFNKNMPFAFLREGYIFVVNDQETEYVTVEGVFEDVTELASLTNGCDNDSPCYDDESEYKMSAWMVEIAKQMIIKNNMLLINGMTDISEDGNPNYKQPTQKPPIG